MSSTSKTRSPARITSPLIAVITSAAERPMASSTGQDSSGWAARLQSAMRPRMSITIMPSAMCSTTASRATGTTSSSPQRMQPSAIAVAVMANAIVVRSKPPAGMCSR